MVTTNGLPVTTANIELTQPELLFSLRALGLPDIPGVGEKPWGNMELEQARQAFREAGLALKQRGLIWLDEKIGQVVVEPDLTAILSACAYPQQMVAMVHRLAGAVPVENYYYRRGSLAVHHTIPRPLTHHFQTTTSSNMGLETVCCLFDSFKWQYTSELQQIPLETYEKIVYTGTDQNDAAASALQQTGMPADLAVSFLSAVHDHQVQVLLQLVYSLEPELEQNLITIFANETAGWLVERVPQFRMAKLRSMSSHRMMFLLQAAFDPYIQDNLYPE